MCSFHLPPGADTQWSSRDEVTRAASGARGERGVRGAEGRLWQPECGGRGASEAPGPQELRGPRGCWGG